MKPQHFAVLAVAAVLSLTAAVAVYTASVPWSTGAAGGGMLFPNLAGDAGRITQIEISRGSSRVTLERSGEAWLIKDRGGFPASPEKIRSLLTSLTEAKLTEPKTRSESSYPILELEDPSGKNANSRLIRLLDDSGAVIAETIAGKKRVGGFGSTQSGTYIRKPQDVQTWLTDADIAGGTELRDWTKSRIFETTADKIKTVTVELKGEQSYKIEREATGDHKLLDIPAGKKIKFVNVIDNIVEATAYIDFDDVRKAEGEPAAGEVNTVSFETDTGLKMTYKIRRDGDATWLRLSAAGDGEAKGAADDLMTRAGGWEFKILPSKADALLKKRDDLLEDGSS